MKYVKTVGLSLIAGIAMWMASGATTASATVACKAEVSPCGEGAYAVGTSVKAALKTGTKLAIKEGMVTDSCKKSEIKGEVKSAGSEAITFYWDVGSFSASECSCPVKTLSNPRYIAHWTGLTWFANYTIEHWAFETVCAGVKCVYGGMVAEGVTGEPGAPGAIVLNNAAVPKESGSVAFCGESASVSAEYSLAEPTPIYYTEK